MKRLVLLPLLLACGPNVTLLPLVGDPPEITELLEGAALPSAPTESVAALEDFYRLLATDADDAAWTRLSEATQGALDQVARALETNGRAMLRTRRFPKPGAPIPSADGSPVPTVRVSPVALFLVSRPTRFRSVEEGADRAVVEVGNRAGTTRNVELVRERGEWKLQRIDYADISSAISIRVTDLTAPAALDEPQVEPVVEPNAPEAEPAPAGEPSPEVPRRPGTLDF